MNRFFGRARWSRQHNDDNHSNHSNRSNYSDHSDRSGGGTGDGGGEDRSDEINGITGRIIGGAISVHRHLGPGLLESTYEACLDAELRYLGLRVERQVPVRVVYRDVALEVAYRIDMLVERLVVVELKVVSKLCPVHVSQLLTYLRLRGLEAGLLLNFNVDALVNGGIKRVVTGGAVRRPSESGRSDPES